MSVRKGLTLIAVLAIAGCGRHGALELPPGAPETQSPAAEASQQARISPDNVQPGLIQSPNNNYQVPAETKLQLEQKAPKRAINAPPADRPSTFVLDPLL